MVHIPENIDIEEINAALDFIDLLANTTAYKNRLELLSHTTLFGLIAPCSFVFKKVKAPWLGWMHNYGSPNASKTSSAKLALALDGHETDDDYIVSMKHVDTLPRMGDTISRTTFPIIADEMELVDKRTGKVNSVITAAIKTAVDQPIFRKVLDHKNNNILLTKILAKNLENHLQKAGAIVEITSKLPQVRNIPYAHLLNQTLDTLHGIPQYVDIQKRQVAKDMLSSNSGFQIVLFVMPNGDIYFDEPYSRQQKLTTTNLAFRDYFKGVIRTNDIYLGDPTPSASSGQMQSVIAIPVYSLKDNSTIAGVWAGGIDFSILNKELQSLNITSLSDSNITRVVYVGHNGQKIADSDINKSKTPESFATLNSFKNAINGQSGSIIDTVDNTKMLVTYQPVKAFHNAWVVLLMQPLSSPK